MKVFLVDPSMFTAPYDFALQAGLHVAGAEARLFGRVPRFSGEFPAAATYAPLFYRWSEKSPAALRPPAKAAEHVLDMGRFAALCRRERPDVVHFQWTPLPLVDSLFIKSIATASATVLTVHDTTPFNGNATSRLQVLHSDECWRKFDHLIAHTEFRPAIAHRPRPAAAKCQHHPARPAGLGAAARPDRRSRSGGTAQGPLLWPDQALQGNSIR